MLSGMSLRNFKAFGEEQNFPLAPITLIYGENSSGKSSIIQSLLALAQSSSNDEHFVYGRELSLRQLYTRGDLVNLGGTRDLVFQHDVSKSVGIGLTWALDGQQYYSRRLRSLAGQRWNYEISNDSAVKLALTNSDLYSDGNQELALASLASKTLGRPNVAWKFNNAHPLIIDSYNKESTAKIIEHTRKFSKQLKERLNTYIDEYPNSSKSDISPEFDAIINLIMLEGKGNKSGENYRPRMAQFRKSLESVINKLDNYTIQDFSLDCAHVLTATRSARRPGETFPWLSDLYELLDLKLMDTKRLRSILMSASADSNETEWPLDFKTIISDLNSLRNTTRSTLRHTVHIGPIRQRSDRISHITSDNNTVVGGDGSNLASVLSRDDKLLTQLNETLKAIGIPYEVSLRTFAQDFSDSVFSLQLLDTRTNTTVSMLDVGFGISQVLPIVVQSIVSSDSLVLVEQPELHLHPRQQGDLASLFKRSAQERRNQFIVETHSEQIILRFQRLIREGVLRSTDICVLYVERHELGSTVKRLRIDEDGDFIDEWPGGFFDDGLKEILGIGGRL